MKSQTRDLLVGAAVLLALYFIVAAFFGKRREGFTSAPKPNEIGKPCKQNAECQQEYGIFCVNSICQST